MKNITANKLAKSYFTGFYKTTGNKQATKEIKQSLDQHVTNKRK